MEIEAYLYLHEIRYLEAFKRHVAGSFIVYNRSNYYRLVIFRSVLTLDLFKHLVTFLIPYNWSWYTSWLSRSQVIAVGWSPYTLQCRYTSFPISGVYLSPDWAAPVIRFRLKLINSDSNLINTKYYHYVIFKYYDLHHLFKNVPHFDYCIIILVVSITQISSEPTIFWNVKKQK